MEGGVSHSLFISEQEAAQVVGGAKQKPRRRCSPSRCDLCPIYYATVRPPFCVSHYNRTGLLFTNAMFRRLRDFGIIRAPEHQSEVENPTWDNWRSVQKTLRLLLQFHTRRIVLSLSRGSYRGRGEAKEGV